VGSSNYWEGRLEAYSNGEWGTVCDDGWDLADASVACRQLGFAPAVEARSLAAYGAGSGQIWMSNLACAGTEASLRNCAFPGVGVHSCDHTEDAGVVCTKPIPVVGSGGLLGWGSSSYGVQDAPASTLSGIASISANYFHALALRTNGSVLGWGSGTYGATTIPAAAESGIAAVSAGYAHSLALTTGGAVISWGNTLSSVTTIPAAATSGIAAIAAGYFHNLALTSSGEVVAWGRNDNGETTVPAAALSGAAAIAVGHNWSLALVGGKVVGWGSNEFNTLVLPASTKSGITAIAAKCGRPPPAACCPPPAATRPPPAGRAPLILALKTPSDADLPGMTRPWPSPLAVQY
jgi:hypothetical protein